MQVDALFSWLDQHRNERFGRLLNQLMPLVVCGVLLLIFILASLFFIHFLINPFSQEKILQELHLIDFSVGFFLYFVTAVDYALIIGRMQATNPGSRPRFVMNVFTCLGCFVGVTFVLFLWSFAKEIDWLIIPLLVFAGSVMIKLAFEGIEYFENASSIPKILRLLTTKLLKFLHELTQIFTFWIPELSSPRVEKLSLRTLAIWSFLLPFIIGLDDFVGYMGAMTIYNVFGLLVGIYTADVAIDVIIFVSPKFTKKMVESALLSFIAVFAFLYLAYKSYSESFSLLQETAHETLLPAAILLVLTLIAGGAYHVLNAKKA